MARSSLGLGFVISARDLATPQLRKATHSFFQLDSASSKAAKTVGFAVSSLLTSFGTMGVGVLGLRAALGAADFSGNFTQQLAATQKIMRATSEELTAMRNKVIQTGIATKFSPDQIVEGMKNLGAAGQTANEAIATIHPSALLATAGQISLDASSRAIVGTLKSYSMEAGRATEVSDKLARATQISNFQAKDFETGLARVAAVGGVFKQSLDEILVGMGALRNLNIESSVASTGLREAIRRVSSDANAQKTILKAGVDVYDKQTDKIRDLSDIMFDLDEKLKNVTKSTRDQTLTKIFGARGILAFGAATELTTKAMKDGREVTLRGREAWAHLRGEIDGASGTVEEFNKAFTQTFKGQRDIMRGILETMKTVIGEAFEGALLPLVKMSNKALASLVDNFERIPGPAKKLAAQLFLVASAGMFLLGTLATITIVAAGAGIALSAFFTPIMIAAAGVATTTGIMVAFAAAIGAVAFGIKHNIGGIGDSFFDVMAKVKLFTTALFQDLFQGKITGETLALLLEEENRGLLRKLGRTKQIIFRIQRFFEGMFEGVSDAFKENEEVFTQLKAAFSDLMELLGLGAKDMSLLTEHSDKSAAAGRRWGQIFGAAALLLVDGLTLTILAVESTINLFKELPQILSQAWNWMKLIGLTLAVGVAIWIAANAQMLIYKFGMMAGAAATWLASKSLVVYNALAALSGKASLAGAAGIAKSAGAMGGAALKAGGLIAAAGAAGFAFGTLIDESFGLSDALADVIAKATGADKALNGLDDAYKKTVEKRGFNKDESVKHEIGAEAAVNAKRIIAKQNEEAAKRQAKGASSLADEGVRARKTIETDTNRRFVSKTNDQVQVQQELAELLQGRLTGELSNKFDINLFAEGDLIGSIRDAQRSSGNLVGAPGSFGDE